MKSAITADDPGTPSMICHNEVDTHYYSPDTIQKETRAMPLSFEFTVKVKNTAALELKETRFLR